MPNTPTPGEIAYDAFWQAFAAAFGADIDAWGTIHPGTARAWEAAAQAVLEARASLCPICNAELARVNAQEDDDA